MGTKQVQQPQPIESSTHLGIWTVLVVYFAPFLPSLRRRRLAFIEWIWAVEKARSDSTQIYWPELPSLAVFPWHCLGGHGFVEPILFCWGWGQGKQNQERLHCYCKQKWFSLSVPSTHPHPGNQTCATLAHHERKKLHKFVWQCLPGINFCV